VAATASKLQAKTRYCSRRVASIIERIDESCAGNPMRVLISLTAASSGTSLSLIAKPAHLSARNKVAEIIEKINMRPRKCLVFKPPDQLFLQHYQLVALAS
jgi:hypothetical protein